MTVSPVIPAAPAQATARSRPSQGSDEQSKDFLSYLCSSTQHDSKESPNGSVSEHTAKPNKDEKQADKKTDVDQGTNTITVPVPPLNEPPAAPLAITALLGLPTIPKNDTTETGKTADSNGKAVLSPSIGTDQQWTAGYSAASLATQSNALGSNPVNFTKPRPKLDKPQSNDAMAHPAGIASAISLPFLNVPPPNDNRKVDSPNSTSEVTGIAAGKSNVELLTAGAKPSESAPTTTPGNLAFALRLSEGPQDSKLQQRPPQAPATEPIASAVQVGSADPATAVQAAVGPQLKEQSQQHDGNTGTAFYEVPQLHPQNASDAPQPSGEQEVHATAANLPAHQEITNSEPVRNVHMQVVGDNNSRVDVRLTDRGGELHISVKSGDTNLAQNLQDHMPELTSRLEQQHFQTEVWIPKLADSGKAETSGARDFSSSGDNNSNSSSNSDQQGKRQQQYQPDWVDVLENSTQGTGKTNPTWLQ